MHTLSLFPELLTFGMLAPFIIRLALSYFILKAGWETYTHGPVKWLSVIYFIVGSMLVIGLYTQAISIAIILLIKYDFWTKRKITPISSEQMTLYILASAISLSLLVTGPGAFAIDYPL